MLLVGDVQAVVCDDFCFDLVFAGLEKPDYLIGGWGLLRKSRSEF